MKENVGGEELGKPKSHFSQPNSFIFLYKYRESRQEGDFFPVRLVKTYCKKNYFFLQ